MEVIIGFVRDASFFGTPRLDKYFNSEIAGFFFVYTSGIWA